MKALRNISLIIIVVGILVLVCALPNIEDIYSWAPVRGAVLASYIGFYIVLVGILGLIVFFVHYILVGRKKH